MGWRLADSYGWPAEWDSTLCAWYRRKFTIPGLCPDRRWFLRFGGILRCAWAFVNGELVGRSTDGTMPSEHDITGAARAGENELAVFVTDYERDAGGKTFTPVGSDQMTRQMGIWQDVELQSRPDVYVDDVAIRTGTRSNELAVIVAVRNASGRARRIRPSFCVTDGGGAVHLTFAADEIDVAPNETRSFQVVQSWTGYAPWSPTTPNLYFLETRLHEEGRAIDSHVERFGFREVWIEGHRLMLNGSPVHLAGEWRHNHGFDFFRPEYVRQWFRMLKDMNMNYIRTHTYPHPKFMLDLADEMGILVSLEAAWHFGHEHAVRDERLWQGSMQHVRSIIRRDKNHPSVILYSVGNECRWNADQQAIIANFPRLRALYGELDPTRIAYHDGDSSLWDERTQPLMSRHYGAECAGEGWWDKSRPLHVGEMGKWHYGQPIDNCVWGDDDVFASFRRCHRAIAVEAAAIIELGRANEVTCLFPWNLSGLDNYRPWPAERKFNWPAPSAPHVKPLRTAPYGSEFAWWEPDGKGYVPGVSFERIRHAFRPLALVVRERLNRFFDDQAVRHTVTVVNDTGAAVAGTLRTRLHIDGRTAWENSQPMELAHGYTRRIALDIPIPRRRVGREAMVETEFLDSARVLDRVERKVRVYPGGMRGERWKLPALAVFGDGSMSAALRAHGVRARRVRSIAAADPRKTPLLLVERNAIVVGSEQNGELAAFLRAGGRAVVLEQNAGVMPGMPVETKPAERAHIRGGKRDVLEGFSAEDLEFWGNEPYGLTSSDSWVVVNPHRKPACGTSRVLADVGWGDFGHGGLHWAAMVETRVGGGLALACQLRLTDKAETHPSALRLLKAILTHAAKWRPARQAALEVVGDAGAALLDRIGVRRAGKAAKTILASGMGLDAAGAASLARRVRNGATAVICGLDGRTVPIAARAFGIALEAVDLGTIYNLIRAKDDPLLDGVSNQETYWLDKAHYGQPNNVNRPMTGTLLRCRGAEELLVSESESCWREFYTLNAKAEIYRMPVITHFLWNGPRPSAAGLLRMRLGKGKLILCQVPMPDEPYAKADVFWTHIFGNLSVAAGKSLLDGDRVAPGAKLSEGYPPDIRCILDPDDRLLAQILKIALPTEYRMPNHALKSSFDWSVDKLDKGRWTLPRDARRAVLFFQVRPGRPRKRAPVEGGLPDPQQQTMLDLFGRGRVRVVVNGRAHEDVDLGDEGRGTVADIDLETEWNTVVVLWQPAGDGLAFQWRNRQGRPEVEFGFIPNC